MKKPIVSDPIATDPKQDKAMLAAVKAIQAKLGDSQARVVLLVQSKMIKRPNTSIGIWVAVPRGYAQPYAAHLLLQGRDLIVNKILNETKEST